jgi:hypothetical protein
MLLAAVLTVAAAAPARAQLVAGRETLDFDRPESWGMKYYASLALLTALSAPQRRTAGQVEIGFEGGSVPYLSDVQRRIGFDGTKLEDVNKTSVFGRVRGGVGLGKGLALELAYTPPLERGGATPNLLALALGRPFEIAPSWLLGLRARGAVGTIRADVTCSAAEVAAGADAEANPFQCVRPSQDESRQRVFGAELVVGRDGRSRFEPYAGIGLDHMDLEFHVNAVYSGGRVEDHTVQLTRGTTVSATAGLSVTLNGRFRITGELFYSWLAIARPPSTAPDTEGLLNGRVLVSYRLK